MKKATLVGAVSIGVLMLNSSFAADSTLNHTDKSFVENAAQGGLFEIQGSQLAQTKSTTPGVKTFADRMIADHTKASDELNQIATAKGVTPPTEPSLAQRGKLKALGTLDGNHFDKNFADSVGVSAHKDTVSLFEKEATKGTDPDLKAYAAKTLPTLKDHLKMAQDLQASVKQ